MTFPRILIPLYALLLAGCYDSSFGESPGHSPQQPATMTIGDLCNAYKGSSSVVTSDIVVEGVVTTSDAEGNFFRTFCIEQDGAAIELMVGLDHLHNSYPIGCPVSVKLKGLTVGRSYGVLQAGRRPVAGSGYITDYLGSKAAVNAVLTRKSETLQTPQPTLFTIPQLSTSLCGTLIRIDGLRYLSDTDDTWAGYRRFTDDDGAEIDTYVRIYSDFADNPIPTSRCSLTGILQSNGSRFMLKLRDEGDCSH